MIVLCWLNAVKVPIQLRRDWDTSSLLCWRIDICTVKWWNVCWLLCPVMGKTFLTSHNMLKIQFLKSTPMVIYTASSYDVDKVVFIVRSDFRLPKIIKKYTFTRYGEGLFTWTGLVYCLANKCSCSQYGSERCSSLRWWNTMKYKNSKYQIVILSFIWREYQFITLMWLVQRSIKSPNDKMRAVCDQGFTHLNRSSS